jgi:phage shock protein E
MTFLQQYWPLLAVALWFGYRFFAARRVVAMLPELRRAGATFIDVRSPVEFASGNVPGTVNIPVGELGRRMGEIPRSAPVVVACARGSRSGIARLMLKKAGYARVYNAGNWANLGR